jgi:hypothetical protein
MNNLHEMLNIADIHASRVTEAIEQLEDIFPISATVINTISKEHFLFIELLINRFGKLQDFIGSKIIDAFLEEQGEVIAGCSILDKLHKLEKLFIIDDAELWKTMRDARNHLVHEYPNHPEITATYLNQLFLLAPELLHLLNKIKLRSSHYATKMRKARK